MRSARRSFAPLQKSRRNQCSRVWTEAFSAMVFVPAQKPSGTVSRLRWLHFTKSQCSEHTFVRSIRITASSVITAVVMALFVNWSNSPIETRRLLSSCTAVSFKFFLKFSWAVTLNLADMANAETSCAFRYSSSACCSSLSYVLFIMPFIPANKLSACFFRLVSRVNTSVTEAFRAETKTAQTSSLH